MNCEKCGQEVKECIHPVGYLNFWENDEFVTCLRCDKCGHNFGPVRELIEAKENARVCLMNFDMVYFNNSDLRAQVATLTRERDEIREYASISDRQFSDMKFLFEQAKRDLEDERKTTRARIAELEKERTEARKERDKAICDAGIAKSHADYLERASEVFGVRSFVVHANGTWEWRKG